MLVRLGIHPLAAAGVIAVDSMLFGGTLVTFGSLWVVSLLVGVVLGIAVGLIQHCGPPHDDLGLATGKGIMVGLLTAIPTPLPAVLVAGSGVLGGIAMVRERKKTA